MSLIIKAARFAADAHEGQFRKYNGRPYITHPIRVAGRVATNELATDNLVAAAFLHDVVEDCGVERLKLEQEFNFQVAFFVSQLTNAPKIPGVNRVLKKEQDRIRISKISKPAKLVKLIDRIDNLYEIDPSTEFASLYAKESLLLLEVLRGVDEELECELKSLAAQIELTK